MSMRLVGWLVGLLLTAAGVGAVHYTRGDGDTWKHHSEWAKDKGMPAPSKEIFMLGTAMTAVGGLVIGYLLGKPGGKD